MSPEKYNGGGPAVEPATESVRMDQEFQLQNLRRLAMNPFESMNQYADVYTSPAGQGQKDVSLPRVPTEKWFILEALPYKKRAADCFIYTGPRCLCPQRLGLY